MGSGQRSGPVRRRKRRGKTSERASLIPKSTLSEIFSADDDPDSDEDLELIEVEPEELAPPPKRAPWWSVHPVPPPPRRASSLPPPPVRRAAPEPVPEVQAEEQAPEAQTPDLHAPEVPPLDAVETPLSLQPPPVFDSPSTDAPLVSASEPARAREGSRFPVRAAAALFVLGASVVFGLGLGRAPDAKSAASTPATAAQAAQRPAEAAKPPTEVKPAAPALPAPSPRGEAPAVAENAPSAEAVISLDDAPEGAPSTSPAAEVASAFASAPSAESKPSGSTLKPSKSAALPAFDSALANSAINEAARRAAACRSGSDPQGVAMVMLKYAPSGRVTTAVIEGGPFAGTTAGGCIAMAFRGAHVPAFSGEPVTVRKSVTYP
jgi:hypothetical protein